MSFYLIYFKLFIVWETSISTINYLYIYFVLSYLFELYELKQLPTLSKKLLTDTILCPISSPNIFNKHILFSFQKEQIVTHISALVDSQMRKKAKPRPHAGCAQPLLSEEITAGN